MHERPTRWVVTSRGYENVTVVVLNLAKFKTFLARFFRLAATSTVPLLRYNISAWLDRGKKDARPRADGPSSGGTRRLTDDETRDWCSVHTAICRSMGSIPIEGEWSFVAQLVERQTVY